VKAPRLRVVLPVALLLTAAAPALRALPGGRWLPDPWLLLALWAVPPVPGAGLRRPILLIGLLGLLRSSVSAASPFAAWAGLGHALALRSWLGGWLVEQRFLARCLLGAVCALPLALLDQAAAARFGLALAWEEGLVRAGLLGILWALALAPAPLPVSPRPRGRAGRWADAPRAGGGA